MYFNYNGSICSDIELIKNFIDDILNKLNLIVENQDALFDIKLILNELIINGVFHGNKCMRSKYVNLDLEMKGDKLVMTVKDEGEGIVFDTESYDPEELNCYGRGLILVHGLSDKVLVDKNKITAIKTIN